jgi:arsenite methyltransferase
MSEIDWDTPEIAGQYDRNCDHQYLKGRALVEMMGIREGDSVLDAGCGTGRQALHVSGIIGPSGRITGIDPSSYRIELARKKFTGTSGNACFLVGQAEHLDAVPDHSVDHAYFCSSFHWIDDKNLALCEIFRVLKPGGRVGMTTLDRNCPNPMREIVDSILETYHVKQTRERQRNIKRVTAPELRDLLSGAGFTGIVIEPRTTPRKYGSPEEFLKQRVDLGRPDCLLKELPENVREKILSEITREFRKMEGPGGPGFGNVTLFVVAAKPGKRI